MKTCFIVTLFILVTFTQSPAQNGSPAAKNDLFSTKQEIEDSIKGVPCKTAERLDGVRKLFLSAGANEQDIKVEKFDKEKISNVVVRKEGKTKETVVIGAHYDRTATGCGVTDNWSGITILAHIYRSIRALDTEKSYIFVAFDQEEEGLKGSRAMLKATPEPDHENFCAMVNFDSFGQAYPMALQNASSSKMIDLAKDLAKQNNIKFTSVAVEGASSDSASFLDKKIPAITLSGLGANWTSILHSSSDQIDKVNIDSVYLGYRFGLFYVSKIDFAGCHDFK